ncbi:very long-chain acyl-CoA synthetase-like [Notolabrus celidotus]|uniref:very long-chain acyl-CoA synthetase-like n=1 Tax=Notolabrus celidotus TaxID=1203425 RepID=UPI00148F6DBB|nr:very long-chain acyl-CoA synthetase-like [Notolabrus celidotus]
MLILILLAAVGFFAILFPRSYFFQDVQHVLLRKRTSKRIQSYMKTNYTIADQFADTVKAQPHKPYLHFKDETFTYLEADELSNKAARVLLQRGCVKGGDTVALFYGNEPMFLWLWLGLLKIGCPAALLNYNIRSKSLLHCFKCSGAKALIAAEELQDAVQEVLPSLLEQQVTVFIVTDKCRIADVESFKDKMNKASSEPLPKDLRSHVTMRSPAGFIYTSGTTGLPKAAVVTHTKLWMYSVFQRLSGAKSSDVIYVSLPLYHSAGIAGVNGAIERGNTVVLRTKFSSSQFWDDCRKYNVTVIQYIGEIMRYLCNVPKKPNDQTHKVRLAIGNGMRADVWRDFISRFGNINIREFYGATEGNFSLINYSNKIGSIGRDTFMHRLLFSYAVIKYDIDEEKPVRDSSGFCAEVARGEPGLLVSEITIRTPFSGYAGDAQQTEKKRLHNVFKTGDMYFNTGDILRVDEDNFIYFQDRVGDTFRWKGENVATTEVADVITMVDCIKEANVYGVEVPGQEGRVGMAAISISDGQSFDSAGVFKHVEKFLPTYAKPRFMRIQSSLEVTGTFKHMKTKLVQEGFNPNQIMAPLYFMDEKVKDYIPLTLDVYDSVMSGQIKI